MVGSGDMQNELCSTCATKLFFILDLNCLLMSIRHFSRHISDTGSQK